MIAVTRAIGVAGSLCLCMLIACTHGGSRTQPSLSDTDVEGLIPGLQSPADIAQRVSSDLISQRNGAAFDSQALLPNHVAAAGESALYSPQWDVAVSAAPGDMAYALYAFELPDYAQSRFLGNGWLVAPAAADFWIALGNQDKQTWEWFAAAPGEQLVTPDLAPYLTDGDMLLAIVALTGTAQCMLEWIGFEGSPPEVQSVTPIQGEPGTPTTFSAEVVGTPESYSYAWDFGGGAIPDTSHEESPTVVLTVVGRYDASVTVTNILGSDTFEFELLVGLPNIEQVSPTLGISGQGALFSATVYSTQPVTYAWDFGGGATPNDSDEPTPFVVFGERGTYDAQLIALNVHGSDTWDFTLTVKEPPTASLNAEPTAGVAPQEVSFDANASFDVDGFITKYEWDWEGDGVYDLDTGTNAQASHTYIDAGEFEATVRVTDDDGATGVDSATISIESGWLIVNVPTNGVSGEFTSLAVVDGYPAISCRTSSGLEYIRAEDANGSTWGTPLVLYDSIIATQNTCLAVVNGNPAISFMDGSGSGGLMYIRASDAAGTSWGAVKALDSDGGYYNSLAVVNGRPAIAHVGSSGLEYVRASDANGDAWDPPNVLGAGGHCDLAVINGYPAVSYIHGSYPTWSLSYAQSTDIDGSGTWWSYTIADYSTNQRLRPSLAMVDGHPAVCFLDWVSGNVTLQYTKATNATGTEWPLPTMLVHLGWTDTSNNSWSTSLAVVNGKPCASSRHITDHKLKYISATDSQGNEWGHTLTPYSSYGGSWSSIAEVNGKPAISFQGSVKYAIWKY